MAKFKSKSSRSSNPKNPKSKTKKIPSTPSNGVRRFFFKLELLGQRHIDQFKAFSHWRHDCDAHETPKPFSRLVPAAHAAVTVTEKENLPASSHSASAASAPVHKHIHVQNFHPSIANNFKVALQNDDPDHPDAIIITTLDLEAPPFCCHEDLLAMSRSQLLGVADVLNARLPSALAINTSDERPEGWIRNDIEWIVGIRSEREVEVPGAPRAVRTWSTTGSWSGAGDFDILREGEMSPPTSPSPSPGSLTRKSLQLSPLSARLERLAEEDEEGSESLVMVSNVGRAAKTKREGGKAVKRRKVESSKEADMDMDDGPDVTPTRIFRPRSSSATVLSGSPTPRCILRSHGNNYGEKPNAERVFGGSASKIQSRRKTNAGLGVGKSTKTATPRKTRSWRPLNGYRPFSAPETGMSTACSMSMSTSASADSSLWELSMESSMLTIGRKRKRSIMEDSEMASGTRGMNGKYIEDMDVDVTL
jgi:hypothetical protein